MVLGEKGGYGAETRHLEKGRKSPEDREGKATADTEARTDRWRNYGLHLCIFLLYRIMGFRQIDRHTDANFAQRVYHNTPHFLKWQNIKSYTHLWVY